MSQKLVLIDGHSILNRAFYGLPDLTNSEGLHTNAIYGFLTIMFKILEEEKTTCFEKPIHMIQEEFKKRDEKIGKSNNNNFYKVYY